MKTKIKTSTEVFEILKNEEDILKYIDYLHSTIRQFDCSCAAIISQLGTNFDEVRKASNDLS